DLAKLHVTGHRHLDGAAARARFNRLVGELLLRLGHLGLHLLGLLEDLVHVRLLGHQPVSVSRSSGMTSLASNLVLISSMISSSAIAVAPSASSGLDSSPWPSS